MTPTHDQSTPNNQSGSTSIDASTSPKASMPEWLRWALLFTAPMNLIGAFVLSPIAPNIALSLGFPPAHPLYSTLLAEFILIFGVAYGWMALTRTANRVVIAMAAAGKISFALTLLGFGVSAGLPFMVTTAGLPDLILGALFAVWVNATREPAA